MKKTVFLIFWKIFKINKNLLKLFLKLGIAEFQPGLVLNLLFISEKNPGWVCYKRVSYKKKKVYLRIYKLFFSWKTWRVTRQSKALLYIDNPYTYIKSLNTPSEYRLMPFVKPWRVILARRWARLATCESYPPSGKIGKLKFLRFLEISRDWRNFQRARDLNSTSAQNFSITIYDVWDVTKHAHSLNYKLDIDMLGRDKLSFFCWTPRSSNCGSWPGDCLSVGHPLGRSRAVVVDSSRRLPSRETSRERKSVALPSRQPLHDTQMKPFRTIPSKAYFQWEELWNYFRQRRVHSMTKRSRRLCARAMAAARWSPPLGIRTATDEPVWNRFYSRLLSTLVNDMLFHE